MALHPLRQRKQEKEKKERIPPFSILLSNGTEKMENRSERNPKIPAPYPLLAPKGRCENKMLNQGMRNDPHSVKSRGESLIKENRQTQYSPQKKGKTGSPNSEIQLRAF